ncbi:MAG: MarR family transcriptional regulator [Clostridiales bacterium]|nr:MarR family transcriptional regulator [Clostridiales bacterium]
MLFNEILDVEHKALISGPFKEISINDMHIIEAIGIREPKNMSTVAKKMTVTVGTLTTAINNLVKKGYVSRVRSAEDKRVVLLSLTEKGVAAYERHMGFHQKMVRTVMEGFEGEEMDILVRALEKLRGYFKEL